MRERRSAFIENEKECFQGFYRARGVRRTSEIGRAEEKLRRMLREKKSGLPV
ncbi:MAG: hypothetical protein Q4C96_06510 [Planctomycetia bacterium]|nr:hypothetical protein [Planctomycetia bacterium]